MPTFAVGGVVSLSGYPVFCSIDQSGVEGRQPRAGGADVYHGSKSVVKMLRTGQQQIQTSGTVANMQGLESETSDHSFQSDFAREMLNDVKDSDCGFKSQFAMEMQNSLVIIDDQEKSDGCAAEDGTGNNTFDDPQNKQRSYLEADHILAPQLVQMKVGQRFLNNTLETDDNEPQIFNSTARDSLLFSPKERFSTISRVETVLSFKSTKDNAVPNIAPSEESYYKLQKELKDLQQQLDEIDNSQMQYEAATKQLMMYLELVSSQLAIETAVERKQQATRDTESKLGVVSSGGGGNSVSSAGGSSFRRQRGVRAKRGESIKKAKPNRSYESTVSSSRINPLKTSDHSSDESSSNSCDSGRFTDSSRSCSSRNSSMTNILSRQELAKRGVELVTQVKTWLGGQGRELKTIDLKVASEPNKIITEVKTSPQKVDINVTKQTILKEKENEKPKNNKVVIRIGSKSGHDQLNKPQKPVLTKLPLAKKSDSFRHYKPGSVILPDSKGKVTLHIPFVYKEEVFHVQL